MKKHRIEFYIFIIVMIASLASSGCINIPDNHQLPERQIAEIYFYASFNSKEIYELNIDNISKEVTKYNYTFKNESTSDFLNYRIEDKPLTTFSLFHNPEKNITKFTLNTQLIVYNNETKLKERWGAEVDKICSICNITLYNESYKWEFIYRSS